MTRRLRRPAAWVVFAWLASAAAADFPWVLPRGFPVPYVPADNPMSLEKVALGQALFADVRLSVSGRHSCQSCHDPARAFTDGLTRSRGAHGDALPFNAPTLINAVYAQSFGWRNPDVRSLEQQMQGPLFNEHPVELGVGGREARTEAVLDADPALRAAFQRAFPDEPAPVRMDNVIRAIAAFERTLIRGDAPFDRYVFGGEHSALDAAQKRGMGLFFSTAGCAACHDGINFAGPWVDRNHSPGAPAFADLGTGQALRVPTLRNLGRTAPYLHDGSLPTLAAVLDNYERLANDPRVDARLRRRSLTTEERADLLAFLRTLDSPDYP